MSDGSLRKGAPHIFLRSKEVSSSLGGRQRQSGKTQGARGQALSCFPPLISSLPEPLRKDTSDVPSHLIFSQPQKAPADHPHSPFLPLSPPKDGCRLWSEYNDTEFSKKPTPSFSGCPMTAGNHCQLLRVQLKMFAVI